MLRQLLPVLLLLAGTTGAVSAPDAPGFQAPGGTYVLDTPHSNILWQVGHFGSSGDAGRFERAAGLLQFDGANPEASNLDITIEVDSLNTGVPSFDELLKGPDYMNAAAFPEMRFQSQSIVRDGEHTGQLVGDLTFRGVTRPLALNVTWEGVGQRDNRTTMRFSATGTLQRSKFGFSYGIPMINDEVRLTIDAELIRQP
jgi:polyisoprenoid-binding protein YceI